MTEKQAAAMLAQRLGLTLMKTATGRGKSSLLHQRPYVTTGITQSGICNKKGFTTVLA